MAPWPIHAIVSWLMTWLEIHRPVAGSVMVASQTGMLVCS
jgi:hypothetical protein